MMSIAGQPEVALVAKGLVAGEQRGFYLNVGFFQSDREDEVYTVDELDMLVATGARLTYMLVPGGSEVRIGVDRDEDGYLDRDELDACADPADPASTPENSNCSVGDINDDGVVDVQDLTALILGWGECPSSPEACAADLDGNGVVDVTDLLLVLTNWS